MISRFWDERDGGFYFTAKDSEHVVPRRKQVYDGALPSGNSVALLNLARLALLNGDLAYEEMTSQILKVFSEDVKRSPAAHTFLLGGLDFVAGPAYNVILVGDHQEPDMQSMLGSLKAAYLPSVVVSMRPPGKTGLGYEKLGGKATAYVCRGQTCMPPTNKKEKMLELLGLKQ
jgi:uncharacterized protein YyaL (SSP411 family)